mgnify:CR=1 FL=1
MSAHCHGGCCSSPPPNADPRYRRILWIALLVNAAMFVVELGAGVQSGSAALLADAIDFAGDAANYGVSLWVLAMATAWRARAALLKGASMLAFGVFVNLSCLIPKKIGSFRILNCSDRTGTSSVSTTCRWI